jgi:hypothetical protein
VGPVTEAIQQKFFEIVKGEAPDPYGWLQPVNLPAGTASGGAKAPIKAGRMHVNDLLQLAVEDGASDLHLKVGSYPMLRVRGQLVPALSEKRLDHEEIVAIAATVLPTALREKFKEQHEVDPGLQRVRPGPVPVQYLPAARHDWDELPRHPDEVRPPSTTWRCQT